MKKTFLLLAFTIFGLINLNAKDSPAKWELRMTEPIVANNWDYENDSIKVHMCIGTKAQEQKLMEYKGDNYYGINGYFAFQLENKTGNRVYIEWENARVNNEKPVFDSDNTLKISSIDKREDESVASKSSSLIRLLYTKKDKTALDRFLGGASTFIGDNYTRPWVVENLKKTGIQTIDFLLPVRFENGPTKDIKFHLEIVWTNTADLSQIKVGMKDKDVKNLIGSPESKTKDKETKTEIWHYTNNGDITLVDDKVTEVTKK